MDGSDGIVRDVDELGRVVLPAAIRRGLAIGHCDPVAFYVDQERIVLRKYRPLCAICGEPGDAVVFKEKMVCLGCVADVGQAVREGLH